MSVPTLPDVAAQDGEVIVGQGPSGGRFATRVRSSPSQALENVRRLVERNQRLADSAAAVATLAPTGIVGAGQMGAAIAAAHLKCLLPVVLMDESEEALSEAQRAILAELGDDVVAGRGAGRLLSSRLLEVTRCEERISACGLVLESIAEKSGAKQRLYERLEPRLARGAIWGSNTSAIPIASLAERLAEPGRFCGMHFFHPVGARPLLEIVRGPATSSATVAAAMAHARALGLASVVVSDGPGFAMNRLLLAYLAAALSLLGEGVEIGRLEEALLAFGMAMGPLEMLDEIGLDTALRTSMAMAGVLGQRHPGLEILVRLVKAGQLGRKTGAGFFIYPDKSVNAEVPRLLAQCAWAPPAQAARRAPQWIARQLLGPMVREAVRLLAEGKVGDPRDIDLGVIFGLGFPSFRGGLLWWFDHCGAEHRRELLEDARPTEPPAPPGLAALAHGRQPFYALEGVIP